MQGVEWVDKKALDVQKAKLYDLLKTANNVSVRNTFAAINTAEKQLYRAKGIYEGLSSLRLIDDTIVSQEDIERIEAKISDVLYEKRRTDMVRRH